MELALSAISACLTVTALALFMRAIIKKQSQPHLLAWGIRILLCGIAFLSQFVAGATYSLAMSGTQLAGGIGLICLIAYRQPRLARLERADWTGIAAAGVGVAIWVLSGNPLYGLLGAMLADTAATAIGIRASIVHGTRESVAFWSCAFGAAFAAALAAAGTASIVVILAPLFSCLNAATNIAAWWYVRQRTAAQKLAAAPELDIA